MLTAYFDDSGTHRDSKIVLYGGLIGLDEKHWRTFDFAWKAKLADPLPRANKPPLRKFHMTDCMARDGEFFGYSEPERDAVIHDFRQIILDSGLYGYVCAVHLPDWDHIVGSRSVNGLNDPDFYCMSRVIQWSTSPDILGPQKLALVFDDIRGKRAINERLLAMYQEARNLNARREVISSISFRPSEKCVGLQGADLVAWETYNQARNWLQDNSTPTRQHLTPLAESGRFIAHMASANAIYDINDWLIKVRDIL
jgi:hypothetical protein